MVKPSESKPSWFCLALFLEDALQKVIQSVLQLCDSLTILHPIQKHIRIFYFTNTVA